MKAEQVDLMQGFIGISRGETTINAIIWAGDEDFYFLPVSEAVALDLEAWDAGDRQFGHLRMIMPPETSMEDLELLYDGIIIE
jgi:hypothetical protein